MTKEEKEIFCIESAEINCKRIFTYVTIIAVFEIFLLIFDAIKKDSSYSSVQWAYRILNSVMAFLSISLTAITAWTRKNISKRHKLLTVSLCIYSVLILFCSMADSITGIISSGRENLTMFTICLMLISSIFHVNPVVVITASLTLFTGFEIFTHATTFSNHHTYAPYPIFIIFITNSVAIIRERQLLETLRKTLVIKKLQEQAEHENQLKSQFLANMSHEIRTPMNAIVGMSELALDFNLNDSEKNTIRQIRSSGINLVGIINDILDFSKIESGKMEIVPVDYDLVKMMNDIANVCLVRLTGKPVELILEIEENLPAVYNGDDMRIRQILINLAGNAAKFTEKGFIKIRSENLRKFKEQDGLRISVIDSGVGIREEDLKKLFSAFQQVDMKMNRTKGGTGLGLSISKNLMTLMGGTINVTSEYGKGTCFYIDLPQKIQDTRPCSEKYKTLFSAAERNTENPLLAEIPVVSLLNRPEFAGLFVEKSETVMFKAPKAKVLIVDDNDVNLQVAEGLLKKFGITPELSLSGYDALEKIQKNDYNIVFMDHQMPGMDGIEALEKIRELDKADGKHRIVVALSANAINGAREMFISKGFDDFLAKPVQGKDFASCLAEWLPVNLMDTFNVTDSSEVQLPPDFPKWNNERLSLVEAVSNTGGLENYLKTARTFYLSIEKNSQEFGKFLLQEDIKNFTINVHALKSAARIIGAHELSKKAEILEAMGKEYQKAEKENRKDDVKKLSQEIHERSASMISLYTSYLKDLRTIVEYAENQSAGEELSTEEIKAGVEKILGFCRDCNLPEIEKQFDAIKKSLSQENAELTKMLDKAINDIEFDEIKSICEKMRGL